MRTVNCFKTVIRTTPFRIIFLTVFINTFIGNTQVHMYPRLKPSWCKADLLAGVMPDLGFFFGK